MRKENSAVRLDPGLEKLAERLASLDAACVVATVVSATGSTYSKPGARMLIEADGRITGLLSGGCLEHDLREHALEVLSAGSARLVTYDMRADNDLVFGMGAGCEGCMGILLEPAARDSRARRAFARAGSQSPEDSPTALVTVFEGPAEQLGTRDWSMAAAPTRAELLDGACLQALQTARAREFRWTEDTGSLAAWIQPLLPLPAILICGAGPDAAPLAAALRALHLPVTVTDHRPSYARADQFPGATVLLGPAAALASRLDLSPFFAAVVMSHHLPSDAHYLRALAATPVHYLGVLGPERRRMRLLAELGSAGAVLAGRLRGPIGLDIGAVTPEGIALAIAAEIHAVAATHNAEVAKQNLALAGESSTPQARARSAP